MKTISLLKILSPLLLIYLVSHLSGCDDSTEFVYRKGDTLYLDYEPFRFQGTNNYYMHYKSDAMIDDVLINAVKMNVKVIRIWGFLDGDNDHKVDMQPELGVYEPREGYGSGWERMDYTVKRAGELGIKLVVVFANNWNAFGGVNQYVQWLGLERRDDFFTDARAKQAYKNYVSHLINRTNTYTNIAYKDDPTIMTWELMNEPRVESDKTGKTLVDWTNEMSTFVKSIDKRHLVALGSEGFFNREHESWAYNGYSGVDWEAILSLPYIDYGTVHLYPEHWGFEGQTETWGSQWIIDHDEAAKAIGKPWVLEEYGTLSSGIENRAFVYEKWTNLVYDLGAAGSMFWILTGIDDGPSQDERGLYADYDGFRIVNENVPDSNVLRLHGRMMETGIDDRQPKIYLTNPAQAKYVKGEVHLKSYVMDYGNSVGDVVLKLSSGVEQKMEGPDENGYYTAVWDTTKEVEDSTVTVTVETSVGKALMSDSKDVIVNNVSGWNVEREYKFEESIGDWRRDGEYQATWGEPAVVWTDKLDGALQINAQYPGQADWEELRFVSPTLAEFANYQRMTYELYFPVAAYDEAKESAQAIRPYIVLNPGWVKIGVDSVNKSLNEFEVVTMGGEDYYKVELDYEWDPKDDTNQVFFGVVTNFLPYSGTVYVKNIAFYSKL